MKRDLMKKSIIPEGIEVSLENNELLVKGKEGESRRTFDEPLIKIEVKDKELIVSCKKATKNEKKKMNTIFAHIKNMMRGVDEKFVYKMKICHSHFPMKVEIEGEYATIKNFLGEKIPRKARIIKGVNVEINGNDITISSIEKEFAGQVAANFESATKVSTRDRRIFQDGIFITSKDGREM